MKELAPVLEVEPFPDNDALRRIYDVRVDQFQEGIPVFGEAFVSQIIAMANGKPDNMLRICREFLKWSGKRKLMGGAELPGIHYLRVHVRDQIEKLRGSSLAYRRYLEKTVQAVRDREPKVSLGSEF